MELKCVLYSIFVSGTVIEQVICAPYIPQVSKGSDRTARAPPGEQLPNNQEGDEGANHKCDNAPNLQPASALADSESLACPAGCLR